MPTEATCNLYHGQKVHYYCLGQVDKVRDLAYWMLAIRLAPFPCRHLLAYAAMVALKHQHIYHYYTYYTTKPCLTKPYPLLCFTNTMLLSHRPQIFNWSHLPLQNEFSYLTLTTEHYSLPPNLQKNQTGKIC